MQGIEVMVCLDVSNSLLASSTDDPRGEPSATCQTHSRETFRQTWKRCGRDSSISVMHTRSYLSKKRFLFRQDVSQRHIHRMVANNEDTAIGAAVDMAVHHSARRGCA